MYGALVIQSINGKHIVGLHSGQGGQSGVTVIVGAIKGQGTVESSTV